MSDSNTRERETCPLCGFWGISTVTIKCFGGVPPDEEERRCPRLTCGLPCRLWKQVEVLAERVRVCHEPKRPIG